MARKIIVSLVLVAALLAVARPVLAGVTPGGGKLESTAFTSGSLSTSSSRQGAILSAQRMGVGDAVEGSITIANTGTLAGKYTLSGSVRGAELASRLALVVKTGETTIYQGTLAGLDKVELGTLAPSSSRTFHFKVSLPRSTGDENALQGLSAGATFTWSAVAA